MELKSLSVKQTNHFCEVSDSDGNPWLLGWANFTPLLSSITLWFNSFVESPCFNYILYLEKCTPWDVCMYIEPVQTPELDISCEWCAQGNICVYPTCMRKMGNYPFLTPLLIKSTHWEIKTIQDSKREKVWIETFVLCQFGTEYSQSGFQSGFVFTASSGDSIWYSLWKINLLAEFFRRTCTREKVTSTLIIYTAMVYRLLHKHEWNLC